MTKEDLIKRSDALTLLHDCWWDAIEKADKKMKELPTIEAEPIKHGRWILRKVYEDEYGNGQFNYFCSECGVPAYEFSQPYCHRCGARMDGGENGTY